MSAFHGSGKLAARDRLEFRHFQFPASAREGEEGNWCIGVHSKEGGGSKMVGRILDRIRIWKGCLDRMFHRIGFKQIPPTRCEMP